MVHSLSPWMGCFLFLAREHKYLINLFQVVVDVVHLDVLYVHTAMMTRVNYPQDGVDGELFVRPGRTFDPFSEHFHSSLFRTPTPCSSELTGKFLIPLESIFQTQPMLSASPSQATIYHRDQVLHVIRLRVGFIGGRQTQAQRTHREFPRNLRKSN